MKVIQRLNVIFLGITVLVVTGITGVFWFTSRDNAQFGQVKDMLDRRSIVAYQQALSGRIELVTVNGLAVTKQDKKVGQSVNIKNTVKEHELREDSLIFIGGSLEQMEQDHNNNVLAEALQKLAEKDFGKVVFTGNLIKFQQQGAQQIQERIGGVKELISSSFGDKFNIAFGTGDIACGRECVAGWQQLIFGKKTEDQAISLAYAFKYKSAKILLLAPDFFSQPKKNLEWLETELKNNQQKKLIVVSYGSISDFKVEEGRLAKNSSGARELFERYKVDLVVFGDQENFFYQRQRGVSYMAAGDFQQAITGGENRISFVRVDFTADGMLLVGYNQQQEKVDEFKIK